MLPSLQFLSLINEDEDDDEKIDKERFEALSAAELKIAEVLVAIAQRNSNVNRFLALHNTYGLNIDNSVKILTKI